MKNLKTINQTIVITGLALLVSGCAEEPKVNSSAADTTIATNLKSVSDDYVPESISEDGLVESASANQAVFSKSSPSSQKANDDICGQLGFLECQPRLIRAYLKFGKAGVILAHKVVADVSQHLAKLPESSSGSVHVTEKNLTVNYVKRSSTDFDFLILEGDAPVGHVSANSERYLLQFDLGILEKDKPDSRRGKLEISVKFQDRRHWISQLTVTNLICNPEKPDDPETARITVERKGELWSGQSMFYNGIAGAFDGVKSCSTPASDSTGLTIYTDFVANRFAAKAALYLMARTEADTSAIENFAFSQICQNYPALCQSLATASSTTPANVNAHLATLANPYCVRRGSLAVAWNSDCRDIAPTVGEAPFSANTNWLVPFEFYQLEVSLPTHL